MRRRRPVAHTARFSISCFLRSVLASSARPSAASVVSFKSRSTGRAGGACIAATMRSPPFAEAAYAALTKRRSTKRFRAAFTLASPWRATQIPTLEIPVALCAPSSQADRSFFTNADRTLAAREQSQTWRRRNRAKRDVHPHARVDRAPDPAGGADNFRIELGHRARPMGAGNELFAARAAFTAFMTILALIWPVRPDPGAGALVRRAKNFAQRSPCGDLGVPDKFQRWKSHSGVARMQRSGMRGRRLPLSRGPRQHAIRATQ